MADTTTEAIPETNGAIQQEGDTTDAFPLKWGSSGGQKVEEPTPMETPIEAEFEAKKSYDTFTDTMYNMDHPRRGYALILNNKNFEARTQMGTRTGTDVDAAKLYSMCKKLGFQTELKSNQTCNNMLRKVREVANLDHTDMDCFLLVVLSHGDEGIVYGTDGVMALDILTSPFKGMNCPSLVGKPKLFMVQACRGTNLDHGATLVADASPVDPEPPRRIPQEADVLMCFSTVPGYYSWRNSTKGSWFVQSLCQVMERIGESEEIMRILTRTNHMVAYEFQSNASSEHMNEKKQIPCIMSMLTKDLYFRPKKV